MPGDKSLNYWQFGTLTKNTTLGLVIETYWKIESLPVVLRRFRVAFVRCLIRFCGLSWINRIRLNYHVDPPIFHAY